MLYEKTIDKGTNMIEWTEIANGTLLKYFGRKSIAITNDGNI